MIRFYTNRELSRIFSVNLAKWKRWSREFLPPDALGGLQSGYARQYNQDDAFTVYLGGHLVADLKFSIPEAKKILDDLSQWFAATGFSPSTNTETDSGEEIFSLVKRYQVLIESIKDRTSAEIEFVYTIRGIISENSITIQGYPARQVQYVETVLPETDAKSGTDDMHTAKVLSITGVYARFLDALHTLPASPI